mmetsp:Transcript_1548/g.3322  ORF Transcript_1548/g.3322 Transcript_1548/m.3322 type:complete len:106 (-) Transcript_1548:373-690(-)
MTMKSRETEYSSTAPFLFPSDEFDAPPVGSGGDGAGGRKFRLDGDAFRHLLPTADLPTADGRADVTGAADAWSTARIRPMNGGVGTRPLILGVRAAAAAEARAAR